MFRRVFTLCALLACTAMIGSAEDQTSLFLGIKGVTVSAAPISVADIPHASLLRPVAGWVLDSDDEDFGGLSALTINNGQFMAVTDAGLLIRIERGLKQALLQSLPKTCVPHQLKRERDSESLVQDPVTGRLWVGFEYRNAICRIDPGGKARLFAPPAMSRWLKLSGPEAMLRRGDGRFVVIAERAPTGSRGTPILIFDRDPTDPEARVTTLRYRAPAQYRPVDAAMLPDGRMLVVNRRYQFPLRFSAIVTLVEPFAEEEDALIEGKPVILLAPPHIADNFEGISIETRGKETHVWLVSDNNFLPEQRTYLLDFVLTDARSGSSS